MRDFAVAFGLVLALEGLVFAAFPTHLKRVMESVMHTPDAWLRTVGIVSALLGVLVIWFVRG